MRACTLRDFMEFHHGGMIPWFAHESNMTIFYGKVGFTP